MITIKLIKKFNHFFIFFCLHYDYKLKKNVSITNMPCIERKKNGLRVNVIL
jgi:hypothetical protein